VDQAVPFMLLIHVGPCRCGLIHASQRPNETLANTQRNYFFFDDPYNHKATGYVTVRQRAIAH